MIPKEFVINAFTLPVVASADSLDKYLQTIKQFPVLTAEEEYGYATRLKQSGDLEAARALIVSHLRLVASIARGYSGYGLPQSDLIQEGNIGLMKAVKRFDPDRGVRLVSFAMHWIKAEIHEYIVRNWRLVKTATTKAQRKLFFNLRSMKNGFETLSQEDVQRIATELNVKPEDVTEMEYRLNGQEISLDAQVDEDGEEVYSPIAFLEDEGPEPSTLLENLQTEHMQTEGLSMALQQLDERSRRVLQARWLTEGNTATLHDLAAEFSVSAERIRQIEQKAMQKIKTYMLESK
ncbi:RNA polymerase sigma factor RpoH [Methylophilus sp. YYY-1]|uniref:RNA polymerase sigma factor RpoH n=1 Tax=Methylophilus sp. YYY-1 TaxID=2682087 RepID=UPI0023B2A6A5|nr:RNA polymerase sigma factor RpoH [Methylophilus sp. YYY-1]